MIPFILAAIGGAFIGGALSKKEDKKLAKGGFISNQYIGKSAEDVWDAWTIQQREHFLADHDSKFKSADWDYDGDTPLTWNYVAKKYDHEELPHIVKMALDEHIQDGEYAKGGEVYNTLWYAIKEHKDWDENEQHELHGLTWTKAVKKAKEIANEHKKEVRLSTSKEYNNQGHYIYFDYKDGGKLEYWQERLKGKTVDLYQNGDKNNSSEREIIDISVAPSHFTNRDVILTFSDRLESKFPLSKLEKFSEGHKVEIKGVKESYTIQLIPSDVELPFAKGGGVPENVKLSNMLSPIVEINSPKEIDSAATKKAIEYLMLEKGYKSKDILLRLNFVVTDEFAHELNGKFRVIKNHVAFDRDVREGKLERGGKLPEKGSPEWHQLRIAKDTIKYPIKGELMGGMTVEEAEKIVAKYDEGGQVKEEDKVIELISDHANPKKKVSIKESNLILQAKKYFKWRNNVTLKRIYGLDSSDYDKFIDYLSKKGIYAEGGGVKTSETHFEVDGESFEDYKGAYDYCYKHRIPHSEIVETKEFKEGGGIPNNYAGKDAEDVWSEWTKEQRLSFLADHHQAIKDDAALFNRELEPLYKYTEDNYSFDKLPKDIKHRVELHVSGGQYAKGGETKKTKVSNKFVVVSEKIYPEGVAYWTIVSKPVSSKKEAELLKDNTVASKDETIKVVTLKAAKAHKHIIGEEYLNK